MFMSVLCCPSSGLAQSVGYHAQLNVLFGRLNSSKFQTKCSDFESSRDSAENPKE